MKKKKKKIKSSSWNLRIVVNHCFFDRLRNFTKWTVGEGEFKIVTTFGHLTELEKLIKLLKMYIITN